MQSNKLKPTSIEEYIKNAPAETQEKLHQLHACIRAVAPGATESLKWNMPAYSYQKIIVCFAIFKKHIGLYPMPSVIKAFEKKIINYKTGKGSIQFPLDKPLPITLISKIVKFRVKESQSGAIKWRS